MKKIFLYIIAPILVLGVVFSLFNIKKSENNNMKEKPLYLTLVEDSKSDPNTKNKRGEPVLFDAIRAMNFPAVKQLVSRGADINARGLGGSTPVILLGMINQWEMAHWFIEQGADPLIANNVGANVAWLLQESDIDPQSPIFPWVAKVKKQLEDRGVKFPVPMPNAN